MIHIGNGLTVTRTATYTSVINYDITNGLLPRRRVIPIP